MGLFMKINLGKGLLRLYILIYVFWLLIGLGYYFKALAPHVGINYWTIESYIERTKEECDAIEKPPNSTCVISMDDSLLVPAGIGIPDEGEISEAPKTFFSFFIALPTILLLIMSIFYKGIRWVIKGFKENIK